MQRGNGWDVDRVSFTCDLINSRRASCSRQLLRFFNLTMSDAPLYGVSKNFGYSLLRILVMLGRASGSLRLGLCDRRCAVHATVPP